MPRRRSWTDEDLTAALEGATSWSEVKRRLGLRGGGRADRLRQRCDELGLDTSALPAPGEPWRSWRDDELRHAVVEAKNLAQVFQLMGLAVGGQAWRRMQEHIQRLDLDTSHWDERAVRPGGATRSPVVFDDERLAEILPEVRSRAELARRLGLDPTSGTVQKRLRERIAELGLPTSHLGGQAWAKGQPRSSRRRPLDEILVAGSSHRGSGLRDRLIEEGVFEPRCSRCGIDGWQGRPAPLQLDHVDGDPTNNQRSNLRLLCPNCHAQTPTYCGRNIGRR